MNYQDHCNRECRTTRTNGTEGSRGTPGTPWSNRTRRKAVGNKNDDPDPEFFVSKMKLKKSRVAFIQHLSTK